MQAVIEPASESTPTPRRSRTRPNRSSIVVNEYSPSGIERRDPALKDLEADVTRPPIERPLSWQKRLALWSVTLVFVAGGVETLSALGFVALARFGGIAYIPTLSDAQLSDYLQRRDPYLGWGTATDASGHALSLSPRPDPAFPSSAAPCISTYGDSFTQGTNVSDSGTFPHFLAMDANCRVANFGVGAYGSDQAFMLFRSQSALDRAPVVVLAHVSENILRNVNQYRNLLYPGSELGFKPRFSLQGDELRYVPVPIRDAGDYRTFEEHPDALLPYEAFLDRPRRSFPYSLALARFVFEDYHVRSAISGVPRHAEFYRASHPAKGLQLTTRILTTFAAEARSDGRSAVVVLIPSGLDFSYHGRWGTWPDDPLNDALVREGVETIHIAPAMLSRLKGMDPCRLFEDCHGHFNEQGNKMIADIVAAGVITGSRSAHR